MSAHLHPKGHDGKTADLGFVPRLPESPVISKFPHLGSAIARCDTCMTSFALTGRPGTTHMQLKCTGPCENMINVNDGRGFTFWGMN